MSIHEKLKLYTRDKNKTLSDRILLSFYVKIFRRCANAAAFKEVTTQRGVTFMSKQLSSASRGKCLLLCRRRHAPELPRCKVLVK